MQYKGFKRLRRAAAVILSAALLVTELPQTGIVYAAQTEDFETFDTETAESSAEEPAETGPPESKITQPETETAAQTESAAETIESPETQTKTAEEPETGTTQTETSATEPQTGPAETGTQEETESKTTETETTGTETGTEETTEIETTETETNETETNETETIETETTETETIELETEEPVSIKEPDIDASVYQPASKTFRFDEVQDQYSGAAAFNASLTEDENGVYTLNNKDEFLAFLTSRVNYQGKTVNLNCDVDMKNETAGFSGIFSGKFNGNGHSVINFKTAAGLFRTVDSGAEVKNLHISSASFEGTTGAGVIAGRNNGTIENCVVTGTLTATAAMDATAGIAAQNDGTIRNCAFSGKITAADETEGYAKYIAGIAGKNNGTIDSCYAVGTLTTKASIVAGIAADNSKSVKHSYNYMNVSGTYSVAGVTAENRDAVEGCRNYGTITCEKTNETNEQAGGICAGNTGVIRSSCNYGNILGNAKNVGGIAGYTSRMITECGNYGEVTGASNVGGIVGLCKGTESKDISKSYNKAKVTGNGTIGVGGILGSVEEGCPVQIMNCYNTGQIITASSVDYIGGIAGAFSIGSIAGCYNAGDFTIGNDKAAAGTIAGFLGSSAECKDSYFKAGTLDYIYNKTDESVKGTEYCKTVEEMKADAFVTLMGSEYTSDSDNSNDGYPVLTGQTAQSWQYPVIYELNGGCLNKYFDIVDKGSNVPEPQDRPTKNNAEFKGWFEDKELKTGFGFSSSTTAPRTVYAGWQERVSVESMELLNDSATLVAGGTYDISVKFTPQNAENTKMRWESDDVTTATVDENGRITAVKPGEAVITGRLDDNSLSTALKFTVKVSSASVVTWIRDADDQDKDNPDYGKDIKYLDIAVGDTYKVEVIISGNNISSEDEISWSTDNDKIAVVEPIANQVGGPRKATIKAVKPGDATISVKYKPKNGEAVWATLNVTVRPLAKALHIKLNDRDATKQTVIYDYATSKFVAVGTSKGNRLATPAADFGIQVEPADASHKVIWEVTPKKDQDGKLIEDTGVIEIDKYTGKIKALSDGTTTVTVRSTDTGKASATVTVKVMNVVQEISFKAEPNSKNGTVVTDDNGRVLLAEGQKVKLRPQYLPANATNKNLAIDANSNKDVLDIVKDKSGYYIVTAKKDVTQDTEITVEMRALDLGPTGDGVKGTVKFIVKPKVKKINIYKGTDLRNPVTGSTIGINPIKDEMEFKLSAKNTPDNSIQLVTWKSDNETIAAVEDNKDGTCMVKVKEKKGKAVITATAADGSGITAKITVSVEQPPSEIVIKGSHKVVKGKTIQLKAEIKPLSASNKEVEWRSLDPAVAKIDKGTGVVTGVSAGETQIIARSKVHSAVEAYYAVTVTEPIKNFKIIEYSDIVYDEEHAPDELLVLNNKAIGLDPDNNISEKRLKVYVTPAKACQDINWKSSNEKVVKVSEDGTITAVGLGKAKITAASTDGSDKKASVSVNVATLTKSVKIKGSHYVGTGKTIQLTAEVGDKDAKNKAVRWSSGNSDAVSVDAEGKVTGIRNNATVQITAEAADGSGAMDTHTVFLTNTESTITIKSKDEELYPIKDQKIECEMKGQAEAAIGLTADISVPGESGSQNLYPREVKWSSSDPAIASVDETGMVTVIADGTVKISAKSTDGFETKDTVTLTVKNSSPKITGPSKVAVKKKIKLSAGKTAIASWSSSDKNVATVNAKGQVTAKSKGTVTITAVPKSETMSSGTYTVEVTDAVKQVKIALPKTDTPDTGADNAETSADNREYVNGKKLGMDIINGYQGNPKLSLVAVVDGIDDADSKYVTWKSSKKSVATVDEKGNVTPIKAGTAKITATAADGSGKKATVTIVVAKQVTQLVPADVNRTEENGAGAVYIAKGKTVQLKVAYKPLAATTKKVTWTVAEADKSYVSVNKTNGKVKAKNYISREDKPYATVYATANDNSGIKCEFHVYVSRPVKKIEITTKREDGQEDKIYAAKSTLGVDIDINGGSVMLGTKMLNTYNEQDENQRVVWKSGNTKIAKVDSDGKLTGVSMGKTTLTATVQDGTKKQCKINVYVGTLVTRLVVEDGLEGSDGKLAKLKKGSKLDLSQYITARPITATKDTLSYKSNNKKVVQISSKGKITVKGKGTATVTATTTDGSNISLNFVITIS